MQIASDPPRALKILQWFVRFVKTGCFGDVDDQLEMFVDEVSNAIGFVEVSVDQLLELRAAHCVKMFVINTEI